MGGAAESQIAYVSAWDPLAPDILPKAFFFLVPPVVRLSPKEKSRRSSKRDQYDSPNPCIVVVVLICLCFNSF